MWKKSENKPTVNKSIVYITNNWKMGVLNPSKVNGWESWEFHYASKYNISYWAYQHQLIEHFNDELWEEE